MTHPTRFSITFDTPYALLSRALFLSPENSHVEIDGSQVNVAMAWGFRASFDRACVVSTSLLAGRPISRGVHGWNGRWLVNGSGERILVVALSPAQRAYVMGFPVKLRELQVSVGDPSALAFALGCPLPASPASAHARQ